MATPNVYLSIPIRFYDDAARIQQELEQAGMTVLNPCTLVPHDCPKDRLPAFFAHACFNMIDRAEALILFSDYYGRDCATEVGYAIHSRKPIFPIVLSNEVSENLIVDWMIRPMVQPLSRSCDELARAITTWRGRDAA
jgi:nucleoside 2-deoxyribosyltransferase